MFNKIKKNFQFLIFGGWGVGGGGWGGGGGGKTGFMFHSKKADLILSDTFTVVLWINVAPLSTMSQKTTDMLSFLVNLGGTPEPNLT